ncbi:SNF2 helicase associated domain-containing protein [Paenibacillus sp. PsM32]|uniref:DEAD/DEAH box helicase n=1 Tax=Paenibacillus sp. PsM32 TaxID=3030536 RepID=UPI00263B8620|nr:SNF2 helicase associated domain-containing protein [Paenibacillus sp. PsM32]MDN4619107.1 SNF2 helicase associated domain-containing protein [Paenibacillus sp. PsM32]
MSTELHLPTIELWCGKTAFAKGKSYYRNGKVSFIQYDQQSSMYQAIVNIRAKLTEQVSVNVDEEGEVYAQCSCPSLSSYDHYCQHIAAVLIHIYYAQQQGIVPILVESSAKPERSLAEEEQKVDTSQEDNRQIQQQHNDALQLTWHMLSLFADKKQRPSGSRTYFETRTTLQVEWICKPIAYGNRQYRIGIEMKVGPKRVYIVQQLIEFLEHVKRRESYYFSKSFTYDPELHSFARTDDRLIQHMLDIVQEEQQYGSWEAQGAIAGYHQQHQRLVLIPASHWQEMLEQLSHASSTTLEYNGQQWGTVMPSQESLPIQFQLDRYEPESNKSSRDTTSLSAPPRYELHVEGLEHLIILEWYETVISYGQLIHVPENECQRLSELQSMLQASEQYRTHQTMTIPEEQLEPFIEQVIPGLMTLGQVHMTRAVSEYIVRTPLQARLYLDRVRDRLLAGLEFQYGQVTINPLDLQVPSLPEGQILLRDGKQEEEIMMLLDEGSFVQTEGGYFLTDEDAEYEFLYHILPRLEQWVEVYATSAVKARVYNPLSAPKLKVNTDPRHDWLELTLELDGIAESQIIEVLNSLREQRRYHRLPNGALLPLEQQEFRKIIAFIQQTGMAKFMPLDHDLLDHTTNEEQTGQLVMRMPLIQGLAGLDQESTNESVQFGKSLRLLLDNLRNPDLREEPVPAHLAPILRDYQQYGYQWMRTLAHYGFGGILADDMGLGKTLQSITFLASMLSDIRRSGQPALIVTPASLMYNWQHEIRRFAPEIHICLIDGSKTERNRRWYQSLPQQASDPEGNDRTAVDVIITSYPLLRRDLEQVHRSSFHTLILDEAQTFKNDLTQVAKAVKQIKAQYRFALTGTPIENSIYELWAIMHVVFPQLLGDKKSFADLSNETVAKRIRPFVLRRLKKDVLKELPDKQEHILISELLPEQKKLYAAYLARLQQDALKHLNDKAVPQNKIKILAGLTRLRQLCCHPALFVQQYEGGSAKLEQLLEIVEESLDAGKRLLIFSQFTEMLGIIGQELQQAQVPYFNLDGSTPVAERVELCNRYNQGERDIFLISLKAGGTGLNLTGADTVILYDLWWNPAVEEQAADRAHRIGQQNTVQVIRLIAQGTVEDKMFELQQTKKHLIDEVIQAGTEQPALTALTEEEIRQILMI